jgi:predicted hydrocarbon binding protein
MGQGQSVNGSRVYQTAAVQPSFRIDRPWVARSPCRIQEDRDSVVPTMALTKGVGFNNVQSFVSETYGAKGWADTLAMFQRADREVLESVLAMGWYDLDLYARLIRTIDRRFGDGDLRLAYAIGRYEAEKNMTMIHQWVLRLLRPSSVIEQIGKYWRRFHDTGDWIAERRGEREIIARLSGWGVVDNALCRELTGYLQRTLELLGGGDVSLDHTRCRARGEPDGEFCEFRARYRFRKDRDEPGTSSQTAFSRAVLLEALRGPSPSSPPPASESGPSSEPRPGRYLSSRPPSSTSQEVPRSERWGVPPSSSAPTSASRPSSPPGSSSTPPPPLRSNPTPMPGSVPPPPLRSNPTPMPGSVSTARASSTPRLASTSEPSPASRPAPLSTPPPSTRGRRGR